MKNQVKIDNCSLRAGEGLNLCESEKITCPSCMISYYPNGVRIKWDYCGDCSIKLVKLINKSKFSNRKIANILYPSNTSFLGKIKNIFTCKEPYIHRRATIYAINRLVTEEKVLIKTNIRHWYFGNLTISDEEVDRLANNEAETLRFKLRWHMRRGQVFTIFYDRLLEYCLEYLKINR